MHHWKFGLLADAHGPIILAFPISASVPYLLDSRIAGRLLVRHLGDDHRKVAEQLGEFFTQVRLNLPKKESGSGDRSSQAAV